MAFWVTCKIAQAIQPIWQHIFALPWSALKKPPWEFNFFYIFGIPSSSRHEKRCQMLQTLFWLFQCSKNPRWSSKNFIKLNNSLTTPVLFGDVIRPFVYLFMFSVYYRPDTLVRDLGYGKSSLQKKSISYKFHTNDIIHVLLLVFIMCVPVLQLIYKKPSWRGIFWFSFTLSFCSDKLQSNWFLFVLKK